MDIFFYLLLFIIIVEPIVCCLCLSSDYYFKLKQFKVRKAKGVLFFSSDKTNTISCATYWFNIFNYAFSLIYTLIAIIDSFFYRSHILFRINFYSIITYGVLAFVALIIIIILTLIDAIKEYREKRCTKGR